MPEHHDDDHDLDPVELALMRRIAATITAADDELHMPPPGLWERIDAAMDAPVVDEPAVGRVIRLFPSRDSGRRLLGAAAAVVLVVVLGGLVLQRGDDGDGTVVATASLTNADLPRSFAGSAQASVVEREGHLELELDVPALPVDEGFYELWLINGDVTAMQSIGIVAGDGRFVLPNGLDIEEFPVVDVSYEPPDGVPAHSGQSILRGVLVR